MQNDAKLAKFLRDLRARLGLNQVRLAVEVGVSLPTISRWERGKAKTSPSAFRLLSQYIKRVSREHPDLLTRFRNEVSFRDFQAHTLAARPARTSDSRFIFFQPKGSQDVDGALLDYVNTTSRVVQKLFRKARSGDPDAREALRLTCEFANKLGYIPQIKPAKKSSLRKGKDARKSRSSD